MDRGRFFLAVLIVALLWPAGAGASMTAFSYSGGEQMYAVPAGVQSLWIKAIGAPGGRPRKFGFAPGRGAVVSGIVDVTPGQVLYVEVGGPGGFSRGGFNGGGDSPIRNGLSVYGGGGASDVRTLPMSAGAMSLTSRLIVAAGGGGSGGIAAAGGDAGAPGGSSPGSSVGGGAGTGTAGGAGGCDALLTGCGLDASLGIGGAGGSSGEAAQTREGAGGGAGLYGGGGGGGVLDGAVGGGGGGSSLVPSDLGRMSLASLTTAPTVEVFTGQPSAEVSGVTVSADGTTTFLFQALWPGSLDVLETARIDNLDPRGNGRAVGTDVLLEPGFGRFVFARSQRLAEPGEQVLNRVVPNQRGRTLIRRHRLPIRLRLWVKFTTPAGAAQTIGFYGLRVPSTCPGPMTSARATINVICGY
jgi:Glycine rich protein